MQTSTSPMPASQAPASLRQHPELQALLKQAESRQLTEEELTTYSSIVPQHADRAAAAAEIAAAQQDVVEQTVNEILHAYPMDEAFGDYAPVKCLRDVSYISAYATAAMLLGDTRWFDEKMLFWARTMLQASPFPAPKGTQAGQPFTPENPTPLTHLIEQAAGLPLHVGILHVTYKRMLENYREVLSAAAYEKLEPMIEHAVAVITSE